jgi:hypothetical protein
MKNLLISALVGIVLISLTSLQSMAQTSPASSPSAAGLFPWTDNQLMEPADLAAIISNAKSDKPLIFNIGAVEDIKGAKHIGPVSKAANLNAFKSAIASLPKNTVIVIYCGCCPFTRCPNIQPAFLELKKLGFTNIKVLNLGTNLKTNWISKGYRLAGG